VRFRGLEFSAGSRQPNLKIAANMSALIDCTKPDEAIIERADAGPGATERVG